jgi:hypothetical protein
MLELPSVPKVYLETSFFSACVTTRTDADSQSWKGRSLSWLKTQAERHELFISDEVLGELAAPAYPNSRQALRFTVGIPVLEVTDEVLGLAQVLIDEKVMPGPLEGDAVHVAVAAYLWHGILVVMECESLGQPKQEGAFVEGVPEVGTYSADNRDARYFMGDIR